MRPQRLAVVLVALVAQVALAACARRPPPPMAYGPYPPQVLQVAGPTLATTRATRAERVVPQALPMGGTLIEPPYMLDSGDRLRIVVFGQDGLTNTYAVDASGNIAMPLIGSVPARGGSTQQLAQAITARLRNGYIREPHVTVEVVSYRPFFILGEVNNPGQYPYVANMTIETAVAIAGGFSPRAKKGGAMISRGPDGFAVRFHAPITYSVHPGDTIRIEERWF